MSGLEDRESLARLRYCATNPLTGNIELFTIDAFGEVDRRYVLLDGLLHTATINYEPIRPVLDKNSNYSITI